MFGYVKPYNDELKLKEIKIYKKYYCALCNELRKSYGRIATLFLSYEMVFTLILLESFSKEENLNKYVLSCQLDNIHIGSINISESILQYIAYINIHLVIWKLEDDWRDDKNIFAYLLKTLLVKKKRYQMYGQRYYRIIEIIDKNMIKFYEWEKEGYDFDSLSEIMGEVWSQVVYCGAKIADISNEDSWRLENICKDMGKWLYCIDAYDDLEKDMKKNRFNPLVQDKYDIKEIEYDAKFMLQLILRSLSNKINEINLDRNNGIVCNIISYGLSYKVNEINRKRENNGRKNRK